MFKTEIDEMSLCNMARHNIDTGQDGPIYQQSFRVPIHYEKAIEQEIQKLKALGIIRSAKGSWASRLVPVTNRIDH